MGLAQESSLSRRFDEVRSALDQRTGTTYTRALLLSDPCFLPQLNPTFALL
jgi:hypothetical protein